MDLLGASWQPQGSRAYKERGRFSSDLCGPCAGPSGASAMPPADSGVTTAGVPSFPPEPDLRLQRHQRLFNYESTGTGKQVLALMPEALGLQHSKKFPRKVQPSQPGSEAGAGSGRWGGFPAVAGGTLGTSLDVPEMCFLRPGNPGSISISRC